MTESQKLIGTRGCKLLTGTGAHTSLTGYAIIAQEDTVFTTFEVDGVDALATFGLTGATVKAGAYIVVPSGDAITAITMSSGSVIIYNQ
jgi:hydrogenase maturation factor